MNHNAKQSPSLAVIGTLEPVEIPRGTFSAARAGYAAFTVRRRVAPLVKGIHVNGHETGTPAANERIARLRRLAIERGEYHVKGSAAPVKPAAV